LAEVTPSICPKKLGVLLLTVTLTVLDVGWVTVTERLGSLVVAKVVASLLTAVVVFARSWAAARAAASSAVWAWRWA
jgi:hypothetical protein